MASDLYSVLEQARETAKVGNHSMALIKYRLYLKYERGDPHAWADYAGSLIMTSRFDDSLLASGKALEIDPDFELALFNKAVALYSLDKFEEAKHIFIHLLTINPDKAEFILGLQKCLSKMGDTDSVESELLKILNNDPSNIDAMTFLIPYYMSKNDQEKIKYWHEKLINLKFNGNELLFEKGGLLLKLGEYQEGFKLFEYRPANINGPVFAEQRWNGEPFPERALLLYWEQGLGDTIMMLRYGPLVKALGGNVILKVQSNLLELAKTCDGFDNIITDQDTQPKFDLRLPLMSLPLVLRTDLNTIPSKVPYLSVPAFVKNRDAIIERLNQSNKSKRIGLVWAGNKFYKNDALRSISPNFLAPLEQYKQATWYSIQRETPDLITFNGVIPIADLMDTFDDTAFIVSNMDLIITVDTAIAHLAGALGKPVILMLSFLSDWRWMLARSDSLWYPSIRIYRQSLSSNWAEVIKAVLNDCDEILKN
jgi:tetratricopeptide (TPR) repeat protein